MENLICHVEECKYNHGKGCSAKEIAIGTSTVNMHACCSNDTACEKFEKR